MRLVGRGHPQIRATHAKTLEFSTADSITDRATCVVAVRLQPAAQALAGPVRLTLRAGNVSFLFEACANSSWDPAGSAVIRRSPLSLPGTFATRSDAAASDVPPDLVQSLRDPGAEVELHVEPVRSRPCAVLFAVDAERPDDPRLAAELSAADVVVAEDDVAARLIGERATSGPIPVDGRVLVLAARELPGATVAHVLDRVGVETVGLTPPLAAAAASASRGPLVFTGPTDDALRDAPAGARLVVATPAGELTSLLERVHARRGTTAAVVVQAYAPPMRVRLDAPIELPSQDVVHVCLDPADQGELDPRIRAAIDALLADGVGTRPVARALSELSGWPRRRAYAYVLEIAGERGGPG